MEPRIWNSGRHGRTRTFNFLLVRQALSPVELRACRFHGSEISSTKKLAEGLGIEPSGPEDHGLADRSGEPGSGCPPWRKAEESNLRAEHAPVFETGCRPFSGAFPKIEPWGQPPFLLRSAGRGPHLPR